MGSKLVVPILIAMMLVTGVCNTLLTKYQDNQCVRNCDDPNPKHRQYFSQPVLQTLQMFIGETGCWLVVGCFSLYRRYSNHNAPALEDGYEAVNTEEQDDEEEGAAEAGVMAVNTSAATSTAAAAAGPATKALVKNSDTRIPLVGARVLLLSLPAICDICGTTLMNVGLLFVVASIYQMTRGALVLFVGVFSVMFLRRRLQPFQWFALVTVVLGVGIVGLAGALFKDGKGEAEGLGRRVVAHVADVAATAAAPDVVRTIVGILLIAGAQIFTATQFVLEEFILEKYALEPLKVVGWEGIFGTLVTLVGMVVLHFAVGRTDAGRYGYFDVVEGWREMTEYKSIGVSTLLIMICIGGFNYCGLSVTRNVSATSRSLIDTSRTLFIWIVSLFLGWESFKLLQVLGFAMLVYGTFLFNGIIRAPLASCTTTEVDEELLPEEPIEHH